MEPTIKLLSENDVQQFKELRLNSLTDDPLSWHSSLAEENNLDDSFFYGRIVNSRYVPIFGYYGYFENEKLLAYAQLSKSFYLKKSHIATLYDVVVTKEARRKSIGRKLITFIISKAKSVSNIEQIHLKVNSENKGALKFYEALGFKKTATIKDAVKEPDGSYQDEYEYVLKL